MAASGVMPRAASRGLAPYLLVFLAAVGASHGETNEIKEEACPGTFNVRGYGEVSIVPTGWKGLEVSGKDTVVPHMNSRAYFADRCTGVYDNRDYLALNLLGKTFRYTTDISGASCGCNAALYLTSMHQNTNKSECGDYYCDANNVCGESCAEIDIMEANKHAWHSTLHAMTDHDGLGMGFGGGAKAWSGPRDWTEKDYGIGGHCIDTTKPFDVEVSFPVDKAGKMSAMEITLRQEGRSCPLTLNLEGYKAVEEVGAALAKGMTPIISYWESPDMLWLDGKGLDHLGPCRNDNTSRCEDSVKFYNFSIVEYVAPPTTSSRPTPKPWQAWTTTEQPQADATTTTHWWKPADPEEVCPHYMETIGCAWTKTFSCPGQETGSKGYAAWDGSHGFQCCCQQELWKEAMGCSADYGAQPGDPVCCGQEGTAINWGHICPKAAPHCVGFEQGVEWGTCHTQQTEVIVRDEEFEHFSIDMRRHGAVKAAVAIGSIGMLTATLLVALRRVVCRPATGTSVHEPLSTHDSEESQV